MFTLLFVYLKKLSPRKRALMGLLLGSVFLCFCLLLLWRQNFADTIKGYLPEEPIFYAHINLNSQNQKFLAEPLEQITIFFNLSGLDYQRVVKRELAVVANKQNGEINYDLIIRTDNPAVLENYLTNTGVPYKFLDDEHVIIGAGDLNRFHWSSDFVKKIDDRFYPWASVQLYLSQELINEYFYNQPLDNYAAIISDNLKDKNGDLLFNFLVQDNQLIVVSPDHSNFRLVLNSNSDDYDVSYHLSRFGSLYNFSDDSSSNPWLNEIKLSVLANKAVDLNQPFFKKLADSSFTLTAKKNSSSSDSLLGNFSFVVDFSSRGQDFSSDDIKQLEVVLRHFLAVNRPSLKTVSLSDNTKVKEIYFDPEKIVFQADSQGRMVYQDEIGSLGYYSNKKQLTIFNDSRLKSQFLSAGDGLAVKTVLLPDSSLWRLFKRFNFLVFSVR